MCECVCVCMCVCVCESVCVVRVSVCVCTESRGGILARANTGVSTETKGVWQVAY